MKSMATAVSKTSHYAIHSQLGQGIFGITYYATDTESGQAIVIKTLADSLRQHPDWALFKQRLQVGAKLLSGCQHPNLVPVRDYFEEAGCPYWVMDYIPGQTLEILVQAGELVSVERAIDYISQIGAALGVLHRAGLIHRDVRPQNIIRCAESHQVVLTDFGIACELTTGVMQTYGNMLSLGYAPMEKYLPSQLRTSATDVYGLAATLYYLLTGNSPTPAFLRDRIPLLNLRQFHPQISPALEQAIWLGLETDPKQRPQTVEAWLALLQETLTVPVPDTPPNQHTSAATVENSRESMNHSGPKPPVDKSRRGSTVPVNFLLLLSEKSFLERQLEKLSPGKPSTKQRRLKKKKQVLQKQNKPLSQTKVKSKSKRVLLKGLILTSAIAASAGMGFGFALRWNIPKEPGATLLHIDQSFPPRSDWPVVDVPSVVPPT